MRRSYVRIAGWEGCERAPRPAGRPARIFVKQTVNVGCPSIDRRNLDDGETFRSRSSENERKLRIDLYGSPATIVSRGNFTLRKRLERDVQLQRDCLRSVPDAQQHRCLFFVPMSLLSIDHGENDRHRTLENESMILRKKKQKGGTNRLGRSFYARASREAMRTRKDSIDRSACPWKDRSNAFDHHT